ncbi:serine/threonine-protein kinase dbf2, partial [Kickxella alabastrina]
MSNHMAQGMDYDQDHHPSVAFAPADGMMHHMFSAPSAGNAAAIHHPQQQQQVYYHQQQQSQPQPQPQQYAQLVNHHHSAGQQQQHHSYQQAAPTIHQAIIGQHSPPSQFSSQNANSNSVLLSQQVRRMRQNPTTNNIANCNTNANGARADSGEGMVVDSPGAFARPVGGGNEAAGGVGLGVMGSSSGGTHNAAGSMTRRNAFLDTIDPAIRRKVEAAQVYFLEYYVDHLTYIANRRRRLEDFKNAIRSVQTTRQHVQDSWTTHCVNESSILRRRRNRTREREFDILAQIGQGGYGQVFLARKRDTGEVCALKKMAKKLLVKLGEVQHILTERDILRTSKSEWLVKLL